MILPSYSLREIIHKYEAAPLSKLWSSPTCTIGQGSPRIKHMMLIKNGNNLDR